MALSTIVSYTEKLAGENRQGKPAGKTGKNPTQSPFKNSRTSGFVQSWAPINFRRMIPLRSMT